MRQAGICFVVMVVFCAIGAAQNTRGRFLTSEAYHDDVYYIVADCSPAPNTICENCILEVDAGGSVTSIIDIGGPCSYDGGGDYRAGFRDSMFLTVQAGGGPLATLTSGIYSFDPVSKVYTSIFVRPTTLSKPYKLALSQDGDLVVGGWTVNPGYKLLKVSLHGDVSTILASFELGRQADFRGPIGRNIETGNYLLCDRTNQVSPTRIQYPVLEISLDGRTVQTWATPGSYGWDNEHTLAQNHRNGNLEAPQGTKAYSFSKTGGSRTLLKELPLSPPVDGSACFDLQTAAAPRWVAFGSDQTAKKTYIYYIDRTTWAVTKIKVADRAFITRAIIFKKGVHIQTKLVDENHWKILLSCPRFPNQPYVLVGGMSGIRNGIPIGDGRRVNLNWDAIGFATLFLPEPTLYWKNWKGVLNAEGAAEAELDLRPLLGTSGRVGFPLWIAMAVLDPRAPRGFAYLPDTYVMRI